MTGNQFEDRLVVPALATADDERQAVGAGGVGFEQDSQVFARFQRADEQPEAVGQAAGTAEGGDLVGRERVKAGCIVAGSGDVDFFGRDARSVAVRSREVLSEMAITRRARRQVSPVSRRR